MSALKATVGKGNDGRVVIDTHAVLEALGVRKGGAPTQEELDAKVLGQLQAVMKMYGGDEAGDGRRSMDGSPETLQTALQDEQERRDERVANILMAKGQQQTTNEVQTQEAERWQRRRQKRQERDKAHRERRVERGRQAQDAVEGGVVQGTASAGVADAAPRGNANHGEGAVVVFKRDPTGEDKKLREALDWSTQAAQSLSQAEARVGLRKKAAMLSWWTKSGSARSGKGAAAAMDKVELRRSRTRRRYEKRLRKALAKERRELGTLVTAYPYPKQAYYVF
ncbi:hypothetical protein PR003_g23694 [Phytophthora rubi]|uniref:Uncharacterized protein n=1 Tax=Phytophthora rubi TaxID=129364 RepID=A0A6A4CX65_9STRA|nr:hypothetical protein PR003_g23694 [Phytophthora rubi]